ncbi:MAG: carbon storage regulator CsrA [Deltaproteobacteria bacterium]|nr:carbon storage regulator CsrA [Deltaproteobacteria bacterium]
MLILTRRAGESVYIGDNIQVKLMEIKGNQIRLGVEAPPSVKIYREEIYLQILAENQEAAEFSHNSAREFSSISDSLARKEARGLNAFKISKKED